MFEQSKQLEEPESRLYADADAGAGAADCALLAVLQWNSNKLQIAEHREIHSFFGPIFGIKSEFFDCHCRRRCSS